MTEPQESAVDGPLWRRQVRVTALLLLAWFVITFVVGYFARELDFSFFGWPFSFWEIGRAHV